MNSVEINQEIISLENQLIDAFGHVNFNSIKPGFTGDANITRRSVNAIQKALNINSAIEALIKTRKSSLMDLLPVVAEIAPVEDLESENEN